jgi:acetyl esterase/lipase
MNRYSMPCVLVIAAMILFGKSANAQTANAQSANAQAAGPKSTAEATAALGLAPAVNLWPGPAPSATGNAEEDTPAIYPFLPSAGKNSGAAIVVCPGGGFTNRCMDYEGVEVAQWLKSKGIAAFALRYRIGPLYNQQVSTGDAQRALRFIRSHAEEYHISANRIGMIGFSAGSDLCCSTAAATTRPSAPDAIDQLPSKPNFIVLAYGGSSGRGGGTAAVMPPTFMYCTNEDGGHVQGMIALYTAMRQARIPVEVHFFQSGDHGTGFAEGDPVLGEWPGMAFNWMRQNNFLTDDKRIPITGIINLDGKPLPRGYAVFTPVSSSFAPPVVGECFNATANDPLGFYKLQGDRAPVAGKYKVEVRQDANRWLSNARDPMPGKYRNGEITQQEFNDYARNKDYSPSIDDQHVFTKVHPSDASDYIVEFKPGMTTLDIEVFSK